MHRHDSTKDREASATKDARDGLHAIVQAALHGGVQATLDELCDGSVSSFSVGWPRRVAPDALGSWLRRGDVVIEVARAPALAAFELALVLHADTATRLVDRLLGAPSGSGAAAALAAPSEAECGVLAYGAARALRGRAGQVVRNVQRDAGPLASATEERVVWPLSFESSFGPLHALAVSSLAACEHVQAAIPLALSVRDRLGGLSLRELEVGDLIVSDAWALTRTASGLTGPAILALAGTPTCFRADLAGGAAVAKREHAEAAEDELELVLAQRTVSFLQAAEIAAGEPIAFEDAQPAQLRCGGEYVAAGELVRHRGHIGLAITALG